MNKHILRLAKQAGYTPLEPRTFADDLNEIFLQKFAELIVRETMNYASRNWEHGNLLAQDLKTHFGVE